MSVTPKRLSNFKLLRLITLSSLALCFFIPSRGLRVSVSDVRVGNIIEKLGRVYEVLKVDHSHEGRGKATIKVELRDIAHGNKAIQRIATDDDIERVYVREKTFMYMCTDQDGTVVLMDSDTLDQIEVSTDLFGKNSLYLQDAMKVKVQFYDDKPFSASVPIRVTCTVKEGIAATRSNDCSKLYVPAVCSKEFMGLRNGNFLIYWTMGTDKEQHEIVAQHEMLRILLSNHKILRHPSAKANWRR